MVKRMLEILQVVDTNHLDTTLQNVLSFTRHRQRNTTPTHTFQTGWHGPPLFDCPVLTACSTVKDTPVGMLLKCLT